MPAVLALVCVLVGFLAPAMPPHAPDGQRRAAHEPRTSPGPALHVPFIANRGQLDPSVNFYARTSFGTVFVTRQGDIVYAMGDRGGPSPRAVVRETFSGQGTVRLRGLGPSAVRVSSFLGKHRSRWGRGLSAFAGVDLGTPFDRIGVRLEMVGDTVEKQFLVAAGGDPCTIAVDIEGAEDLGVTRGGELRARTRAGELFFTKPIAYQTIAGTRRDVAIAYAVQGTRYGFEVGPFDRSADLVIDPLLHSTFLGGSQSEGWEYAGGIDVAVDHEGNVFVACMTSSFDFPTTEGAVSTTLMGGRDIFVSKLDPTLSTLLASTFVGGSGDEEMPRIAVDSDGDVYLLAGTRSADAPTTPGAWDRTLSGSSDLLIAKLDNRLESLLAATLLGGSGAESVGDIVLDSSGDVVVAGTTDSSNFPTTPGAYQTRQAGRLDFAIAKLDGSLSSVQAATLLGGRNHEQWPSLALDGNGNVFLSGGTGSPDFPTTAASYDPTFNGPTPYAYTNMDACISKLDSALTSLLASTFVGTNPFDGAFIIAIDDYGDVYFGGHTEGPDFPTTSGAFDTHHNGVNEYFLSRMSNDLSAILASTFLTPGTSGFGFCDGIAIDGDAGIIVVGDTGEANFPTSVGAYDTSHNGEIDGFVARLDRNLAAMVPATLFGGSGSEGALAVAVLPSGTILVAGYTSSLDLQTTAGAYQPAFRGGITDAYLATFTADLSESGDSLPRAARRLIRGSGR